MKLPESFYVRHEGDKTEVNQLLERLGNKKSNDGYGHANLCCVGNRDYFWGAFGDVSEYVYLTIHDLRAAVAELEKIVPAQYRFVKGERFHTYFGGVKMAEAFIEQALNKNIPHLISNSLTRDEQAVGWDGINCEIYIPLIGGPSHSTQIPPSKMMEALEAFEPDNKPDFEDYTLFVGRCTELLFSNECLYINATHFSIDEAEQLRDELIKWLDKVQPPIR